MSKGFWWDETFKDWDPTSCPSAEDEFFASLEGEPEDLMPEVYLAMERLTPKQRFVLSCRYGMKGDGSQMKVEEIAWLLGVSHPAVMGLLKRALRRLERELWNLRDNSSGTKTEPST